jgi:hypothetical protein
MYKSLVYGVKVHTSETKESPANISVGGLWHFGGGGGLRSVPLETQDSQYINLDNWQTSLLCFR